MYELAAEGDGYKPNPGLRPELANTVELAWQQRIARGILGTASVFRYDVRRLIDLTLDPSDSLFQYRNVGDAHATGFEVELEGRLGRSTNGSVSYTYQDAVDHGTGRRLTNSPEHMVKGRAAADLSRWVGAAADLRYESGRLTLLGTETADALVTDLHLLLPGRSAAVPRGALDRMELSLRLNNVFDAPFATPGGVEHRQAAIPQDGRTVSAELRYRF
jgi:outer membrane receptor protein involved in Fe transport